MEPKHSKTYLPPLKTYSNYSIPEGNLMKIVQIPCGNGKRDRFWKCGGFEHLLIDNASCRRS